MIESRQLALERYNPKFFYAHEQAMIHRNPTSEEQRVPEWRKYKYRIAFFGNQYDEMVANGEDTSHYKIFAKQHDARQPYIKEDILKCTNGST